MFLSLAKYNVKLNNCRSAAQTISKIPVAMQLFILFLRDTFLIFSVIFVFGAIFYCFPTTATLHTTGFRTEYVREKSFCFRNATLPSWVGGEQQSSIHFWIDESFGGRNRWNYSEKWKYRVLFIWRIAFDLFYRSTCFSAFISHSIVVLHTIFLTFREYKWSCFWWWFENKLHESNITINRPLSH